MQISSPLSTDFHTNDMSATEVPETAPVVAGMRKNGWCFCEDFSVFTSTDNVAGKQWHENKTAFRPTGGLTSYEKRQGKRKELETMKAKEKELKEEKEAERQVRCFYGQYTYDLSLTTAIALDTRNQGQTRCQSREGTI